MSLQEFNQILVDRPFDLIEQGYFYCIDNHSGSIKLQGEFSNSKIPKSLLRLFHLQFEDRNCFMEGYFENEVDGKTYEIILT